MKHSLYLSLMLIPLFHGCSADVAASAVTAAELQKQSAQNALNQKQMLEDQLKANLSKGLEQKDQMSQALEQLQK